MENCSGVPGVIHNFYAKGDLPFVLYFDFETTAPTDHCFDPGKKTMFVVSYVMIVAFHPDLKIDRIIIQRSYAHAIEQLTNLDYFSQDQIKCINKALVRQLKAIAFDVSKIKCKKNRWGKCFALNAHWLRKLSLNDLTENLNPNICKLV